MQYRLLGPLAVRTGDGRPVHLGAAKHRIFLGVLLLHANRTVGVDRLTEALWSSHPPRSAASALTTYASALRGRLALGRGDGLPALVADGGGYRMQIAPNDLDLLVFTDLAASGQRALAAGDPVSAVDQLQQALALWRGAPLEDVPLDRGLHPDLAWLDDVRDSAAEASIEARLALGRHAEVVAELGALVAANPLRERRQAMLMTALYRCGRQADALAAYQQLRAHLVGELGIEPSPPLRHLHRQILSGSPELEPPPRVPVGPAAAVPVPRQLPADVSGFTGRRAELGVLGEMLRPTTGPAPVPVAAIDGIGGIGKSTLALHAAHEFAGRFRDGQLYADLRGGSADGPVPPLAVLERFLRAFGVECRGCASLDEVAATFRGVTATRRVLVVLDDAADARQVQPLLPAGPGCAVVVTSRQVLAGLDGAQHLHLDVLTAAEATALLGHVAGGRGLGDDPDGTDAVARLCGYLPLALRIAGGRLAGRPGWPVRALADRLADTHRRLDELQLGELGVRASFQVSLQVLAESADPRDRLAADAFGLAALPDGADLGLGLAARLLDRSEADAEAVLERLVDAQLLESATPRRYRMHDLLRLFGRDQPADPASRAAALVRGLRWYAATAGQAAAALRGEAGPGGEASFPNAAAAVAWLEAERINLCAAVHQAATTPSVPAEIVTTLAHGLFDFFDRRGHRQDWLDLSRTALTVARRTGDLLAEANARRDLGVVHERQGRYEEALGCLEASLAIFRRLGDRVGQARSLTSLGVIHHRQGRYPDAVRCHREALALHRQSADRSGEARSLNNLGAAYQRMARFTPAKACYEDGLAIFRELGDRRIEAAVLTNLGVVHERLRQYDRALVCQQRSVATFRACGDRDGEATSLNNLGRVYRTLGRSRDAIACHREALTIAVDLGERLVEAECLREIGAALESVGGSRRTETYWRQALAIFEELGVPEAAEVRSSLAGLRALVDRGAEAGALSLA